MELVMTLFFNLAIIMLIMFIFNLWMERYPTKILPSVLYIFGLTLSVLVCLLFSIRQYGVMIDLRQIPIIIGGLYFGYGPFMIFFSLLFRGILYGWDIGYWTIVPLYIGLAIFLHYAHPWFLKQNSKKRLSIALLTAIIMNMLIFISFLCSGYSIYGINALVITTSIQFIGTCMISYVIEVMSQSKFLREQMVKAQKIELVSHMSAAISHEVRNPLTAVHGFLQLALEDSNIQENTREYIKISLKELNAAEKVIKDYLTVAQPSMETIDTFVPTELLEQIIKSLQPLMNMNSVTVTIDNAGMGYIKGDKNRFRQCFLNIIKNSIEAMPHGGHLTIQIQFQNREVTVNIKDSGMGMTPEQINRLGEPYFSSKGAKGTGLGLMVSFSIIRELKGTIQIQSEIGKGTLFSITLPSEEEKMPSSKDFTTYQEPSGIAH